jgi:hypothetical protein
LKKAKRRAIPPFFYKAGLGGRLTSIQYANNRSTISKTPLNEPGLHEASSGLEKEIVELLSAQKADVNAKKALGQTPL